MRRYGFHGLSYEYIARRLKTVAPEIADGRIVVAHLGNGSSLCAIRNGRAAATTMGMTPLDGVPMGTRSGQIDPGVLFYLMKVKGMSVQEVSDLIHHNAGLKGLSGLSQDMRVLEASDSPSAKEAIDYFVYRIRREIGSLAAAIDGLDAIVFTGGIGENSPRTREEVLTGMEWLGVRLDKAANATNALRITTADSKTVALVRQDQRGADDRRTRGQRRRARHRLSRRDQANREFAGPASASAAFGCGGGLGELRLQRAIEAGEALANTGEGGRQRGVGLGDVDDRRGQADRLGRLAGGGEARQPRSADRPPGLAASVARHLAVERRGDHPRPQGAARAAADQADAADRIACPLQAIPRLSQGEGDPLHHGACQIDARSGLAEAEEHAAGARIVVRSAFAGKIRQEDRLAGAAVAARPPRARSRRPRGRTGARRRRARRRR